MAHHYHLAVALVVAHRMGPHRVASGLLLHLDSNMVHIRLVLHTSHPGAAHRMDKLLDNPVVQTAAVHHLVVYPNNPIHKMGQ